MSIQNKMWSKGQLPEKNEGYKYKLHIYKDLLSPAMLPSTPTLIPI